jgi:hypothetical protein
MTPGASPAPKALDLRRRLEQIVDAFGENDLALALSLFGPDASYETVSGAVRRGRAAIERELAPQFRGDYGAMVFHLSRLFVDEAAREGAIAWTCTHALEAGGASSWARSAPRRALRWLYGPRAQWDGVDLFRFDEAGLIVEKRTFAKANVIAFRRAEQVGEERRK